MKSNKHFGFTGNLLKVNLNKESIYVEEIDNDFSKKFMGGAGYACRYLIDRLGKDTDALSSNNILMVMTGPLCLTGAPSFSRMVVCSKSPYTGLWGEANAGGFFGPELKRAGYDGLIIIGRADHPVYLKVFDSEISILDATELWGEGIKKTQKRLKALSGDLKSKVLCIGQAGENLVKFANINTEGRSVGRTGMGAVMGSKNLKGIVVKGSSYKPNIADENKFKEISKKTSRFILKALATKVLREYGTSSAVMPFHTIGDLPIKYWSKGEWEDISNITGEKLKENYLIKRKSCFGCSIACGKIIKINKNKVLTEETEGPEYETIAGFGSMILNKNLESIAMANHLCNDYGLDTISTSSVISFLYNLYNKNQINKDEIDNLDLKWGNFNPMLQLIKAIAYRKGIGNLLAEGSNEVGKFYNIPSDDIATVNKLEVPYHDIRSCYGLALTYAFGPRGACHTTGDAFKVLRKENEVDFSSIGIGKIDLFSNNKKMAKYTSLLLDYRALYSSLISCFFSNPPPVYMAELIKYVMGWDYGLEEIKIMGERIFNLKRLFNIKMGLTSENDNLPKILLNPTNEGAVAGRTPDFNKLKSYYYDIRNWDPITGKPNLIKLRELGINNIGI